MDVWSFKSKHRKSKASREYMMPSMKSGQRVYINIIHCLAICRPAMLQLEAAGHILPQPEALDVKDGDKRGSWRKVRNEVIDRRQICLQLPVNGRGILSASDLT